MHEGRFAPPETPVMADEQAEGNLAVGAFQVVDASAFKSQPFFAGFATPHGDGDGHLPVQVAASDRVGIGFDFRNGSSGQQFAAELARSGAEIEQVVS